MWNTISPRLLKQQTVSLASITTYEAATDHHYITVIFLLIPDQVQPRVFNNEIAPNLKDNATIVVASGYNVFYKLLNFKPSQDVVMVAPRYVSRLLRKRSPSLRTHNHYAG